jgi:hypothetical protein
MVTGARNVSELQMLAGALIDNRRIYLFAVVVILAINSHAHVELNERIFHFKK